MVLQHTQRGFIIDVPVTLTVAVRGEGLTEQQAKDIARKFTENLDTDHMLYVGELKTNDPDTTSPVITETSMEFSAEDECEVLDELEPTTSELYACKGCGREESVCSAEPCEAVIADRKA